MENQTFCLYKEDNVTKALKITKMSSEAGNKLKKDGKAMGIDKISTKVPSIM